jgi:HipA-like protein
LFTHSVLSVGLPIGAAVGPRDLRGLDFFENMLPEGPTLTRMAALVGIRPVDTYGMLVLCPAAPNLLSQWATQPTAC